MLEFLKNIFGKSQPPPRNLGRNDPCWCGSGKKYKRCHYEEDERVLAARRAKSCKPSG